MAVDKSGTTIEINDYVFFPAYHNIMIGKIRDIETHQIIIDAGNGTVWFRKPTLILKVSDERMTTLHLRSGITFQKGKVDKFGDPLSSGDKIVKLVDGKLRIGKIDSFLPQKETTAVININDTLHKCHCDRLIRIY